MLPKVNSLKLAPLAVDAELTLLTLGSQLKDARKQRKMSIEEAAYLIGVSKVTYASIESGRQTTQIGHFLRAMTLLNVEWPSDGNSVAQKLLNLLDRLDPIPSQAPVPGKLRDKRNS